MQMTCIGEGALGMRDRPKWLTFHCVAWLNCLFRFRPPVWALQAWSLVHLSYHAWWLIILIKIRIYHDYCEASFVLMNRCRFLNWFDRLPVSSPLDVCWLTIGRVLMNHRRFIVHQCQIEYSLAVWHLNMLTQRRLLIRLDVYNLIDSLVAEPTFNWWKLGCVRVCWSWYWHRHSLSLFSCFSLS